MDLTTEPIEKPRMHVILASEKPIFTFNPRRKRKPRAPRERYTVGSVLRRFGCAICGGKLGLSLHASSSGKRVVLETVEHMERRLLKLEIRQGHFVVLCRDHRENKAIDAALEQP